MNLAIACGFEQLNLGLTHLEECGAHVLILYLFNGKALETQHVLVERDSLGQTGHCYAHMLNV